MASVRVPPVAVLDSDGLGLLAVGGQCIEAADVRESRDGIAIRDSKNPAGPALLLPAGAFSAFIAAAATGEL